MPTATSGLSALLQCDLVVSQGADNEYVFEYGEYDQYQEWTGYDMTGWTARSEIRDRARDGVAWYSATSVDGSIVLGREGSVTLKIPHAATQTEAWDTRSRGVWDIELEDNSGIVRRLVEGAVVVSHYVTRGSS